MTTGVSTHIDQDLCTGCGDCVAVCPARTLALVDGKARVVGDSSLHCGHCAAVCPVGAVEVTAIDPAQWRFDTFTLDERWLAHGATDVAALVRLMASRRSCRNYRPDPVPRPVLDDLVKIGTTAPSGTNSQRWTFTVLPTRSAVEALGGQVGAFFARLVRLSDKAWLRGGLALLGKPELAAFHRDYRDDVVEAMAEHARSGGDRLFHGATAAILVGSQPGGSCPAEVYARVTGRARVQPRVFEG
jgi:ferredoxin